MGRISDYLHKKASMNRIPLEGAFELSPVCNFSCKMCYVRRTPQQLKAEDKSLISWEQWLELARACHDEGTLFLLLTGGEPFLYPGFKELYISLHKMGFVLSINSNATLIDEETVEWLKQYAPSRINITLYGSSPDTYERICGNRGGYERTIRAIQLLKEAGIPVMINASMIPENEKDLEAIYDFGTEHEVPVRMSTYMFPPARRSEEEGDSRFTPEEAATVYLRKQRKICSDEEYRVFVKNTLENKVKHNQVEEDTWGEKGDVMRCRAGRSTFWVSWEGKMTACGMLEFPLATFPFEAPFKECWNAMTDAVRHTEVLHGCNQCPHGKICKPCVAMIYTETGTIERRAPYLCKMTECIIKHMEQEMEEEIHESEE